MSKSVGTCKWFSHEKGFGFILTESGEDALVHHTAIQMDGYRQLREGQQVAFIQTETERGLQAHEVEVIRSV